MPYLTYYFTEDKNGCVFFSQSEVNSRFDGLPNQVLFKYDPNLKSENKFIRITEKDENNDFQIFGKTIDKKAISGLEPCMDLADMMDQNLPIF